MTSKPLLFTLPTLLTPVLFGGVPACTGDASTFEGDLDSAGDEQADGGATGTTSATDDDDGANGEDAGDAGDSGETDDGESENEIE